MKKRVLGILLALVMVLALLPATAGAANVILTGTCGANASWVLTDDGVMTVSGTGTVTQPMDFDTYMDYGERVKTIKIEEGITAIGGRAFSVYALSEETLILPDSLQTIGQKAFSGNSSLKNIRFGSNLTAIESNAFAYCAMETIELPNSLQKLGSGTFSMCSYLKTIVVPGTVKTIERGTFNACSSLEEVVLMDGVETLEPNVFSSCRNLKSVYLPDTIRTIGGGLFDNCYALTFVRIPAQVTSIPNGMFYNCHSLEYVIIPNTVTSIGESAFESCDKLSAIYYAGTNQQLGAIRIDETGNGVLFDVDIYLLPAMPDPVFYLYDMPARDNWAYPGIAFCLYNGLMNGVGNGYFQPNGYTTRAQLVTILWRMMGEPKPESPAPFTDLTQDWYRDAVAWAAENNITKGTSATTFAPDEYVTREQMVTIFYRMCRDYLGFDMSPSASLDKFPDNGKVSDWAVDAMQWGIAVKLINGAADGSGNVYLVPQGNAIRSQVATVMLNFVNAFEAFFSELDTEKGETT